MSQIITVIEDPCDPESWEVFERESIRELLVELYETAPKNLRIYHLQIADNCDVSPHDQDDWEALDNLPGPFYVLAPPEWAELIIAVVVAALVAVASFFLLRPNLPAPDNHVSSSNNALTDRQNVGRPLQRIEDPVGEVRSWPTLLAASYIVFENKAAVAYDLMCIGRSEYDIDDVREDTTPVTQIDGMSVEIWGPNTSALSGDEPVMIIGKPGARITESLMIVIPSSSVNDQVLYPPNYKTVVCSNNIAFFNDTGPMYIKSTDTDIMKWTDFFEADESIIVTGANYSDGPHTVNLDATYVVDSATDDKLFLVDPQLVNSDWNTVHLMSGGHTGNISPTITDADITTSIVGEFLLDHDDQTEFWFNVIAENGLYGLTSKNKQVSRSVDLRAILTPTLADGTPTGGSPETFNFTITGSAITRSLLGWTLKAHPTFVGPCNITLQRLSAFDYAFDGQLTDEIKWHNLYAVAPITVTDFGNVTHLRVRTPTTTAALGVKNRKMNMRIVRRFPRREGTGFSVALYATKSVADIFCGVTLDPFIGNRPIEELNIDQIYGEIAIAQAYFRFVDAIECGMTFDDFSLSAEDHMFTIAGVAYCQPLRRGSVFELKFEQPTDNSILLMNHRNKMPKSENRIYRFGFVDDNDGVELTWYDKDNYDAPTIYRVPTDNSARKPKKIDKRGVRNFRQVFWHAWREYSKLKNQWITTSFTALQSANIIGVNDRILVANNVRTQNYTQDGFVRQQDGLFLTLSQDLVLQDDVNYKIFVQIPNGTVDAIPMIPGPLANQVILSRPPSSAIMFGYNVSRVPALYWVVPEDDDEEAAFIVSEKSPTDKMTSKITAINYSDLYYTQDGVDPSRMLTDTSGNPITTTPDSGETPITLS